MSKKPHHYEVDWLDDNTGKRRAKLFKTLIEAQIFHDTLKAEKKHLYAARLRKIGWTQWFVLERVKDAPALDKAS